MRTARVSRLRLWLAGIFAIAFAVRLLHVFQIRSAPFFTILMGDSRAYDEWAMRIAGGDWIGTNVFYQAPLYPYFLGVIYRFAGRNLLLVRIVQASIGSMSCVVLGAAVRRLSGDDAGIAAGLMLALWAPAIFFDALIQKSVLDVFFVCVVIWLMTVLGSGFRPSRSALRPGLADAPLENDGAEAGSRTMAHVVLGLALGALALTRENALVLIVVVLAWTAWNSPGVRRAWNSPGVGRARNSLGVGRVLVDPARSASKKKDPPYMQDVTNAALVIAGLAIVLGPVVIRNLYVGGGFYLTTSQLGPNLYIGNNPNADGTYASLRYGRGAPEYERQDATELAERALGRRLTPGDVSTYWRDRALGFIVSDPVGWARLTARKIALLLNRVEVVDTESQETHAEWSWPLRVLAPLTNFGVLVPLALLGALVTRPCRSPVGVIAGLAIAYAASVVMFYVFARYRYPLVPFLIVFAAAALVPCFRDPARAWSQLRWPTIAAIAAAVVVANWPLLSPALMQAVTENNLGVAIQDQRRYDEAIAHYRRAVALRPAYPPAYNNMATALRAAGRLDDAVAMYKRALELQTDFPDAEYNLANALVEKGRTDEAIGHYEAALRTIPVSVEVQTNLGIALAGRGRVDDAIAAFRAAVDADPASATAHRNLGDLLATRGNPAEGLVHMREAARLAPEDGSIRYDLGSLLLESGRYAEAVSELREATTRLPGSAEAHNNLGIALGSQGRLDEAIAQFRKAVTLKPDFEDARRNLQMALDAARARRPRS